MHARRRPPTSCSVEPPAQYHDDAELEAAFDSLPPMEEPDEPSDLDSIVRQFAADDARWDAFIADDDEFDPLPEPGDFWTTQD